MYITAQGCRLRNDLYCVEWDVKLYWLHTLDENTGWAYNIVKVKLVAGDRPYRCVVEGCTKAFRQLSSLQQHLKGHNIPLPKSYTISRNLTSYSNGHLNAAAGDHHRKVVIEMHHGAVQLVIFCGPHATLISLSLSLSLRFNGHFPGEPGLAGVYWSKGVVVTTGLLEL